MGPSCTRAARSGRLILVLAIATLAVGCDVMTAPNTPRPSRVSRTPEPIATAPVESDEAPTVRPDGSSAGLSLIEAANALADLDSYRVSVVSRGLVPASSRDGTVTMTSTLVQGDAPAAKFTIVGVDGLEGGRLDAVVIGDEAWLRPGGERWIRSPGGAADFDAAFTALSPIELASGFESLASAISKVGSDTKNGIPSTHYHAADDEDATQAAGLSTGSADLWLARDGGYLVALAVDGTWEIDGTPAPITLRIDVSHVDDPANTVSPPG